MDGGVYTGGILGPIKLFAQKRGIVFEEAFWKH